ncbi:MAG: ACP S-malonyltransferase [Ruminococcaceae bacterium]|nr:ACP S-malonyltransferase [Oscillospiraceae bacterium]
MGKIAILFAGQGDQYPGMGKELYEKYHVAREIFDLCDGIRPGTIDQCFAGTEAELRQTVNTQPCLFAMELAAAAVLWEQGVRPDALAGFSLGEVTAATVAGIFDRETGFRLVCRRGEWMQQAAERYDTAMTAVVKLPQEAVEALCGQYTGVYPVNYNCPGQITVAGLTAEMADFAAAVKAAGGRAIPLKVTGGFHSPFMAEAAAAFRDELKKVELSAPAIPLYSNVTAARYAGDAAALLSAQIKSPVQWERIIRNLLAEGVDTFIEIGPGRTLSGMVRKISGEVRAVGYSEYLGEVISC